MLTGEATHERVVCEVCKRIIWTCRCMDGAANIRYVTCHECERKDEQ